MVLFHVFHVEHFSDEQLKKVKWVEILSEVVYVNLVRETARTLDVGLPVVCTVDAGGSWQMILPMPNLERAY